MFNKSMLIGAICALGFSATASAQNYLQRGDLELSAAAQLIFPEEGDDTLFAFGSFGQFVSDALLARVSVFYSDTGGSNTITVGPGVDYHFGNAQSNVVPYVGVSYLANLGDFDDTDFYEGHVGAKSFLSERVAVFAQLTHQAATDSDFGSQNVAAIGINIYY